VDPVEAVGDAVVEPLRETARRSRAPAWLVALRTRVFAGLAVAGLLLFGGLTVLVTGGATASADLAVTTAVQGVAFPWLGPLMIGVSLFGFPPQSLLLVTGVATLFWLAGQRAESGFMLLAGASSVVGESIKAVVGRPRPEADLVNVLAGAGGLSFPSGHTLFYVTFFGFLAYIAYALWKPGWFRTAVLWVCAILIALVGLSRVWMGQHWASDVLASYALGMACLWLLIQLYSRYRLSQADMKVPVDAGDRPATVRTAAEPIGG
jgi:undecaprenyl-diphosphatase